MLRKWNIVLGVMAAVVVMAVMGGCSTQKADWKNVQFHNTTAHYNIWWNGNESLKEGIEAIGNRCKDDYTVLLPIYQLGTKEECMSLSPQFDRAIEKGVKGIKKHSIFVNGQEHVPYISKCYMLTAYASFYKHDYAVTASTCQALMSQYAGTDVGDEAAILLARCSTQEQRYQDAETALDEMVVNASRDNFSKSQQLNLYLAMAECTMPQEKMKKCVQFIKLALDQKPPQKQRARLYFILGQIYQSLDKRPTAAKYYEKVLKCGPTYEMEFNARLNLASCADLKYTDKAKLEKTLDRMLKDKKNEEFLDQIYYAKGEMYMGMRDVKSACQAFKKSSAVSTNNPKQKARSAIRLAGILYDKYQNYDESQTYYDTAMSLIGASYPHYAAVKSRYDLLTQLVQYTRVFERNDSLIAVANMPEAERLELINKKIEDLKKAEEDAKEREVLAQLANESKAQSNTLQGDWYFYNANTVKSGKDNFRQRWGLRMLEDYWFLSKKGLLGMGMLVQMDEENDSDTTMAGGADADSLASGKNNKFASNDPNDPHNVAYYLKDLPQSKAEQDSMQQQTAICLLNAGYIYYDGIHDIPKALECYLRMTQDYTSNPEIVQAFYMLYKVYDKQGNTPSANYYRDMVLMGFPDSDFSNLILDEDYYKEIIHRNQLIKEDYNDVYTLYRKRRYDDVINAVSTAKELYAGDPMLGKFSYWEGLSYARKDNKDKAVAVLREIVQTYPSTDSIVPLAQSQLDFLLGEGKEFVGNSGAEETVKAMDSILSPQQLVKRKEGLQNVGKDVEQLPPEAQLFRYREDLPHLVIIIVNDKKIRATQLQVKVSDFNATYYANINFKVSPLMFTDSTQIVTINVFNSASEAKDYAAHLLQPESPLAQYDAAYYKVFAISKQNYTTFYNRKKVDAYQLFYEKYYLNK